MISVLFPYRNAEATIDEALASVLAEPEIGELVAIDDGSRDAGPERIARAARDDARIVCARSGGIGVAGALTLGLARARGDFIGRMDADDVSLPGRFARAMDVLAGDPRVAAVGARVEAFPSPGEGLVAYVAWQNTLVTPEDHARDIFVEAPLCHPSVVLRRSALDAVGGWRDGAWPEDYDLWLRLDAAGWALAKVEALGLRWRTTPGRATFADARYGTARILETRARYLAPRLARLGRPIALWGAGKTGRRLARALEAFGVRVAAFVDIDPRKIGRRARGAPIVGPDALPAGHTVVVAVGERGARDIVRARLVARDLVEGRDFVCAA